MSFVLFFYLFQEDEQGKSHSSENQKQNPIYKTKAETIESTESSKMLNVTEAEGGDSSSSGSNNNKEEIVVKIKKEEDEEQKVCGKLVHFFVT